MMKYLILCLMVLFAPVFGKAQKIDSAAIARLDPALREEVNNYLAQAKKAKSTAMVLCISGGSVALIGGIIYTVAAVRYPESGPLVEPSGNPENYKTAENVGVLLFVAGAATALTSIPFFIKVHKKREAVRAIVFADKGVSLAPGLTVPGSQFAGIRLVMEIGRK
jgi:hypothetical protein